ncbi:restriction endonuclease [Staphylococcus pseudintermedius]|uniref:restriction endonuclease n=1 Tax=Staphylococcus pseudintermedius TaxID=283734 RepID=UPI00256D5BF9|nr:restriction endonuclease [Staphylococcus pseudintermedius]MDK4161209.1 restriction endonuclease [Staphylococcus pseudintermedius]MDT0944660.1 restriction endonuclease [Staphylococcus pseudintermedius]
MEISSRNEIITSLTSANINENIIRNNMPDILDILLIDRTTSTIKKNKNIIWANDNYIKYGAKSYGAKSQIKPELITGKMNTIITPRSLKPRNLQKERTKSKGEVFTPTWVVKKQNDKIEKDYLNDNLDNYINRIWLEITCGEAPYMVSRYDMETGELLPINNRVGFLDRKLKRINDEVNDKAEWQRLAVKAFKSSYGFEWSGDSLLLARENMLYTYRDYYFEKWNVEPIYGLFKEIAEIISYNVFQMDGLKYIIPLSEKRLKKNEVQLSLFESEEEIREIVKPGKRVKIMNWQTNKMEYFDKGVKF